MSKEQKVLNPNDQDPFFQTTREIYFGKLDNPSRYLVEALRAGELNIGLISHRDSQLLNLKDLYSIRADEVAQKVFEEITESDDFKKLKDRSPKKYLSTRINSLISEFARDLILKSPTPPAKLI